VSGSGTTSNLLSNCDRVLIDFETFWPLIIRGLSRFDLNPVPFLELARLVH
jgi:hypothetical protein